MKLLPLLGAVALLVLAGCASNPPQPAGGTAPSAIAPDEVKALLKSLRKDLQALPSSAPLSGLGEFDPAIGNGQLYMSLAAAACFEQDNAQFKLNALKPMADIAAAIAARGASVVHVLGLAAGAEDKKLAERRAASVAADLARHGLNAARLRFESRITPDSAGVMLLVVRPVVVGAEQLAWMPPEVTP
jgi:outer membrane protein OmpA-like peptidoglycan-associated protein